MRCNGPTARLIAPVRALARWAAGADAPRRAGLAWRALPPAARRYVATVIVLGAAALVAFFPLTFPRPALFAVLLVASCVTSVWKVNLPIAPSSGSTLSVSYAADLMSLLLLGPRHAVLIAVAGAWTQCVFRVRRPYPLYRTVFSAAAEAVTMAATGLSYGWLGGPIGPLDFSGVSRPLVAAIATYFFVNTGLVAGAIGRSTGRPVWSVWRDDFLWSGASFMVAGGAGAVAAIVIGRGEHWTALLMLAPVYLTYRTYELFVGRLEDQKRHIAETQQLHHEAVDALLQARQAERDLADERERLIVTLRSIGDGVITTDLNGTILSINNVAETLTGWTHEEAAGRPLAGVFQNFDSDTRQPCDNAVATLVNTVGVSRRSTILAARDLTEHPIEECAAPIRNAD
jgi:PAS domain S-box-containing protein